MATLGPSPLEAVRVLDLTTSLAGPYCTLILAALGADVVKVERPGTGDDTRTWGPPFWEGESAMYLAMNAGKRSLAIDLKAPEGLEAIQRIAAGSDVFVQNLRPGVAERLGLGFDQVSSANPRVVYCSITAFGASGPLADRPGYDPLMQAAAGIMSVTGEPGRAPVRAGISVVDQGTGMWAALAIVAALGNRDRAGVAQLVETSLYETAVNWLPYQLAGYLASGEVPEPLGSALAVIAPYEAFATADGLVMIAAGNDRLFAALCEVLGLPELVSDLRFRTNPDRVANRAALASEIAAKVRTEESSAILQRLDRAGVPAAPVQNLAEVAAHPQTQALGLLQPLEHARIEGLRLVALPLSVRGRRFEHSSAPPAFGEHSAELLREAGYDEAEIKRLRTLGVVSGPPDAD
jgi:crotonobetainyl-CoA:carnitine CoA-transferase CaiB-like acyl-CoA transferase